MLKPRHKFCDEIYTKGFQRPEWRRRVFTPKEWSKFFAAISCNPVPRKVLIAPSHQTTQRTGHVFI